MSASDQYRKLAAELRAKSRGEESSTVKAELIHLAQCYVRLAEQADKINAQMCRASLTRAPLDLNKFDKKLVSPSRRQCLAIADELVD